MAPLMVLYFSLWSAGVIAAPCNASDSGNQPNICRKYMVCEKTENSCKCLRAMRRDVENSIKNGNLEEVYYARMIEGDVENRCTNFISKTKEGNGSVTTINKPVGLNIDARINQWIVAGGSAVDVNENLFFTLTAGLIFKDKAGDEILKAEREWTANYADGESGDVISQSDSSSRENEIQRWNVSARPGKIIAKILDYDESRNDSKAMSLIKSVDVEHYEKTATAMATLTRNSVFVGEGSTISGRTLSGNLTAHSQGEKIKINSKFIEDRIGFQIYASQPDDDVKITLRGGAYAIKYNRQTASGGGIADSYACPSCTPLRRNFVFDAEHKSNGMYFNLVENITKNISIDVAYRFGIDNSVKIKGTDISIYNKDPGYFGASSTIKYEENLKKIFRNTPIEGAIVMSLFYDSHTWGESKDFISPFNIGSDSIDFLWGAGLKLNANF